MSNDILLYQKIVEETANWITTPETPAAHYNNYLYLNQLLTEEQRKLFILDLYNITAYYDDIESNYTPIASMFADLLPASGISINANSVTFNNVTYYRGDILMKLENGEPLRVEGPKAGIYWPNLSGNNVTWTFSSDIPTPDATSDPYETYDITISNNSLSGYGYTFLKPVNGWVAIMFPIVEGILPVVKMYIDNNEEIFNDKYTLTLIDYKGECLYNNLPTTNIAIGDCYKITDESNNYYIATTTDGDWKIVTTSPDNNYILVPTTANFPSIITKIVVK